MKVTTNLKIDLVRPGLIPSIRAVEGDTCTREVKIALCANKEVWELPGGHDIVVRYRKPDDTVGIYDTLPDGSVAWSTNGNTVSVTLCPQMLTCPGRVLAQVSIIVDTQTLSTFTFMVDVEADPSKGAAVSEDYISWRKAFLPQTKDAQEGQFLQIAKVDASGRVIEVVAVENPAGTVASNAAEALRISQEVAQEMHAYSALIDSITTSKVSVADIVNNLASNVSNKPLSAAQGVVLKGLIDSVSTSLANYQPKGEYALRSELPTVPTKVSQLTNDSGFLAVVTPQKYGAKCNGSADDTVAFQNALGNNRVVFVPGGTYKLSGELVVGNNCQLELAQDAVLHFTQTTGNCISMKMSANIVGNHATISVPYAFEGHVINIDTDITNTDNVVPPFAQWDPMWKTARFITDLNVVKPDTRGFYYSMDGACSGTAVYLRADYTDVKSFIWAMNLSKLRIAGAFKYGIFAESLKSGLIDSSGWIHQLKMDAFIDACEVGLYLKNIEHTFASVLVLPRRAYTTDGEYIPYAKWGICLENCIDTNLLGSRVMDWNSVYSLWREGNMYQHIALLGNCRDIKLEDHYYHGYPDYDIRDLIYAENPSNLETVSILEEPITRWFKPKNHLPYFNDGNTEKQLLLKDEFNDCFITDYVSNFKDRLPLAIDKDGKIFNEIGYAKSGMRWNQDGTFTTETEYYGCTGLIKIEAGDTLYLQNMQMGDGSDGVPCVVIFDASFNRVFSNNAKQLVAGESSYYFTYEETETGFTLKVKQPATAAYAAFTFRRELIGNNPAVSVNEPLTYSQQGFLADSIAIKTANVIGLESFVGTEIEQAIANGDFKGDPGKTPVKGTDYFTSDDKAEMVNSVIAALPVYTGEVL